MATHLTSDELAHLMEDADHYNDSHPDTVLFVLKYAGGRPDALSAEIARVDEHGIAFHVQTVGGVGGEHVVGFAEPALTLDSARSGMQTLMMKARGNAGDSVPLTSLEEEIVSIAGLRTFETTVTAIRDLTPRMREITFAGGLDEYRSTSPDQFLLVTPPGEGATAPGYYTVRRWRAEEAEMDMWFVLHDHAGPVSGWAAWAAAGDVVTLWGPRSSYDPPPAIESQLLVADDTGIPAIAAILEHTSLPTHVIVETYDPDHRVDLADGNTVTVDWLYRGDEEPGTGSRLLDAVTGLDRDWDDVYAFGAGESRQMTSIRKHLRHVVGMTAEHVQMTGYWRRRRPIAD